MAGIQRHYRTSHQAPRDASPRADNPPYTTILVQNSSPVVHDVGPLAPETPVATGQVGIDSMFSEAEWALFGSIFTPTPDQNMDTEGRVCFQGRFGCYSDLI